VLGLSRNLLRSRSKASIDAGRPSVPLALVGVNCVKQKSLVACRCETSQDMIAIFFGLDANDRAGAGSFLIELVQPHICWKELLEKVVVMCVPFDMFCRH
jgi:hypothetical protein